MIYKERDQLTIVKLSKDEEYMSADRLRRILLDSPSNIIYFERHETLYGIITMGDVARDISYKGMDQVIINRHFTMLSEQDYMQARHIFNEKKTIHNLPIADENGILMGEWTRWDDILCSKYTSALFSLNEKGKNNRFFENYCVALVRSKCGFGYFDGVLECIYEKLTSCGADVECIDYDSVITYLEKVDFVLFFTEDELRAFRSLYTYLYKMSLQRHKLETVFRFVKKCVSAEISLGNIESKGVNVYNLVFAVNEYCKKLYEDIHEKFRRINKRIGLQIPSEMEEDFFDDLYTPEYAAGIKNLSFEVETESGKSMLKDCRGEYYNVINGERVTCGCPEQYDKTLYFVGPCFIYGHYVEDQYTIESILQKILNDNGYKIRVVNCGSTGYVEGNANCIDLEMARITDLPLKEGDILITCIEGCTMRSVSEINLMDVLEERDVNINWLVDEPRHCNHKVNAMYAEAIYEVLEPVLSDAAGEGLVKLDKDYIKTLYIERHFSGFIPEKYDKIGAIVMNCNPFTYGHRYLIEQALEMVDLLIIFVVEENKSDFSFLERFAMVTEGAADMSNVMVVPSGPFILSQTTFPEYFVKAADEDLVMNTENDIKIFAEKIAPPLNIKYRFVGEEPEDMVTNQYNTAMKKILPEYGIRLIEIPRKELNGRYISASSVRRCLEENRTDLLRKLVPESTMRVLF